MNTESNPPPPAPPPAPIRALDSANARALDSATLLAGQAEIGIRHGDELYRLRLTRTGKLILTK